MSSLLIGKPAAAEHAPYFSRYIDLIDDPDILAALQHQIGDTVAFVRTIPESRGGYRYATGKWSIKEVLGHLIDSERVFSYRALSIARGDQAALPGFEQDDWVRSGQFDTLTMEELRVELELVRNATLLLFRHVSAEAWVRLGTANNATISVRALAYIIAGHELHHVRILRSRYV